MDSIWGLLILISIVILLFVLLPSFVETPKKFISIPIKTVTPTPSPDQMIKEEMKRTEEADKRMLDAHYVAARSAIPVDYPIKPIGSCPFSKPLSEDLPLADIPMCMAAKASSDMHLGM